MEELFLSNRCSYQLSLPQMRSKDRVNARNSKSVMFGNLCFYYKLILKWFSELRTNRPRSSFTRTRTVRCCLATSVGSNVITTPSGSITAGIERVSLLISASFGWCKTPSNRTKPKFPRFAWFALFRSRQCNSPRPSKRDCAFLMYSALMSIPANKDCLNQARTFAVLQPISGLRCPGSC